LPADLPAFLFTLKLLPWINELAKRAEYKSPHLHTNAGGIKIKIRYATGHQHTHARPHFLREFPEQYFTAQDIPFRHCCTGKWSPPFVPQWWEKLTQVLQLQFDLQMTQRETWQEIEVENFAESRGKMRKMRQVGLGKFKTRRGKWN